MLSSLTVKRSKLLRIVDNFRSLLMISLVTRPTTTKFKEMEKCRRVDTVVSYNVEASAFRSYVYVRKDVRMYIRTSTYVHTYQNVVIKTTVRYIDANTSA